MYQSFYSAAVGASAYLSKLDVTSNNLANINNYGFKPKNVAFSDLINYNLNDSEDAVTELMEKSFTDISVKKDLSGHDRVVYGSLKT